MDSMKPYLLKMIQNELSVHLKPEENRIDL